MARAERGTLMAVGLLMMIVAGLFISATASLMTTRAAQTTYLDSAAKRRISLQNSKAFHEQFMLERVFELSSTAASNQTGEFDDAWGGVNTSDGWTDMHVFASTQMPGTLSTVFPYNYTGMRPSLSYLATEKTVRPFTLAGAVDDFSAYSFLKTYTPGLGSDPLVVYRKPVAAPGQIEIGDSVARLKVQVNGRMVIRDPESFFAESTPNPLQLYAVAKSLYIQKHHPTRKLYCSDSDGDDLAPSNLSATKSTTGPVPDGVGTDYLYNWTLNVINNTANPDNSLWHFMDREKAAGAGDYETISTGDATGTSGDPYWIEQQINPTYPPPRWPSGYPPIWKVLFIQLDHIDLKHLRVLGAVDQVVLNGQVSSAAFTNAGLLPPLMITIIPNGVGGTNVQDMRLVNENNRRMVLGVQDWNAAKLDMYWEGSSAMSGGAGDNIYDWRMVLVNEYRTLWANLPSSIVKKVRISGGLMTNWSFKRRGVGSVDRLQLSSETNPQPAGALGTAFSALLPRDGWMETYFLPTPTS